MRIDEQSPLVCSAPARLRDGRGRALPHGSPASACRAARRRSSGFGPRRAPPDRPTRTRGRDRRDHPPSLGLPTRVGRAVLIAYFPARVSSLALVWSARRIGPFVRALLGVWAKASILRYAISAEMRVSLIFFCLCAVLWPSRRHVEGLLMEWSGRAPALPAREAGKGCSRQGARHVSEDSTHRSP
jgi:hypothetical protein